MKHPGVIAVGILFITALSQGMARAQVCGTIPSPGFGRYLTGTQKCDLGAVGTTTVACTDDAGLEATFPNALTVLQVPSGWNNWSAPPNSESSTPIVGFTGFSTQTTTIALTSLAEVLGFETEANLFGSFPITAVFRDIMGIPLATISQTVTSPNGARLFALVCTQPVIADVVVTVSGSTFGFAIAQIRSDAFAGTALAPQPAAPATPAKIPEGVTSSVVRPE